MLENGFGEHNIQGIGDKHIPLIHNVMNTDVVVGDQRPGHRRARRAVQHRRPAGPTSPTAAGVAGELVAALEHFGLLVDLQRARRDQDGQAARPRPRRRHRHGRHRRRGDVPERAGQDARGRASAATFDDVDAAEVFGEHLADVDTDGDASTAPSATATASSTSATTPGSSSRARRSSCSRRAVSQAFWRGLRRFLPRVGRDDHASSTPASPPADARPMTVAGWRCAVCGTHGRHRRAVHRGAARTRPTPTATTCCTRRGASRRARAADDANPFVAFRPHLAWDAFAAAQRDDARRRLRSSPSSTRDRGRRRHRVRGHAVRAQPTRSSTRSASPPTAACGSRTRPATSAAATRPATCARSCSTCVAAESLGLAPWASPAERPPLAIASCGNAAIAAATLAAAVDVADRRVRAARGPTRRCSTRSTALGAPIVSRARAAPTTRRATRACSGSARPSPPAPSRSACRARRTRCASTAAARSAGRWPRSLGRLTLDRVFVQVGGGALAACVGAGLAHGRHRTRGSHAVQTDGCAPLARAWDARRRRATAAAPARASGRELMCAVGARSARQRADGILDDETYDWLAVVDAMTGSGGSPVVVDEALVRRRRTSSPVATHRHRRVSPPAPPASPACWRSATTSIATRACRPSSSAASAAA